MPNQELEIWNLRFEIKDYLSREVLRKYENAYSPGQSEGYGFGLRIMISFVEEEKPLFYIIERLPVYRRREMISLSNGLIFSDFSFFEKKGIFMTHDSRIIGKQISERYKILKSITGKVLTGLKWNYFMQMLQKFSIGLRIQMMIIKESPARFVIKEKVFKYQAKIENPDIQLTDSDKLFLQKHRLTIP